MAVGHDVDTLVLDEPKPLVLFSNFGDSALEILFGVWFAKEDFFEMRSSIMTDIKERFDAEGIEIAFPHRTLYTGLATEPFPVRLVGPEQAGTPPQDTPAPDEPASDSAPATGLATDTGAIKATRS